MIRAIIFDFDGVLVDSEPLHYRAFLRTAQEAGLDIDFSYDEYLQKYVGLDDREGFRAMIAAANAGSMLAPDFANQVARLCEEKKDIFAAIVAEGFDPIAGAIDFVKSLTADFPIAIASGATRADIDIILGPLDLAPRFDPIICADDVPRSKPDPMTYRMAFAALAKRFRGLRPDEVLAIEDTAAGIDSARGAGLIALGITTTTDAATLKQAHRVVDGFRGLSLEMLQQWFAEE